MRERFGLERRDGRNLLIVAGIVALVLMVLTGGPVSVRFVVGVVGATISAATFLLVTIVLKTYTSY